MLDMLIATDGGSKGGARKALTFALSVCFHAAVAAAVILVPLLRAESRLPKARIVDATLVSPPVLPGVPPAGRPRNTARRPGEPGPEKEKPRPRREPGFIIPTEIGKSTDEDLTLTFLGGGGVPGVEGGMEMEDGDNRDWVIGRDFVPEAIRPDEAAMVTVRAPRLVKKVNPVYPVIAISARVSGPVEIEAVTDIYGRVREARVTRGHALLNGAALEAVREWIYEPYFVNGIPRPVRFKVTVTFTLEAR
ncbi:MAG: energy transducer TonB [Candidatus Aminicenantes bacterium]|nr:energy transducer TonB [Candidatus Aminicenantes bacterium]